MSLRDNSITKTCEMQKVETTDRKSLPDYKRAEKIFQQVLAIWERALGPNHPFVSRPLNNLSNVYRAQGNYERSEKMFRREGIDEGSQMVGGADGETT